MLGHRVTDVHVVVVLDLDPEQTEVAMFALFHLIYGGVLGAIVGYGLV